MVKKIKIRLSGISGKIYFYFLIGFFIAGYVFFLTSYQWMPVSSSAKALTPLGTEKAWNGKKITVIRWDYCEKKQEMEVELDIRNTSFDGQNTYDFSVQVRGGGEATVTPVIEEPDWIIVQINDVPKNWGEILLRVDQETYNETTTGALKLFTNTNDVNRVDQIETKDWNGYRRNRFETQIASYEEKINSNLEEIEKLQEEKEEIAAEITRLSEAKMYQTQEEQEETDQSMAEAQKEIAQKDASILQLQEENEELNEKIVLQQKQMEEVLQ